jgi:hypothetical protein
MRSRQLPIDANILPIAPKPPRLVTVVGLELDAGAALELADDPEKKP